MAQGSQQERGPFRQVARFMLYMLLVAIASATTGQDPSSASAIQAAEAETSVLPLVTLDALDGYRWSLSTLEVAPGQTIRVTNRGALAHTFVVDEWGVDLDLPTLDAREIVVPEGLQPGEQFVFYCDEPGHRALGQWGTITIVTPGEILLADQSREIDATPKRQTVSMADDYSFSPAQVQAIPGEVLDVVNTGVLHHQFAVEEWDINETVSPGETVLIQIPQFVNPGEAFAYYCTVPGHQADGMEGLIAIAAADVSGPPIPPRRNESDIGRFLPPAETLGTGWALVRTGNARAVLPDYDAANPLVFPGEGRGASYTGPAGSRVTIIVLPFEPNSMPTNQIEDAILTVQLMMMAEWETDLRSGRSFESIAPPPGCDVANRASGVTRVYTLPAGSTACQLRGVGVTIFVTIEGQYAEASGVEAADLVMNLLLLRATVPFHAE